MDRGWTDETASVLQPVSYSPCPTASVLQPVSYSQCPTARVLQPVSYSQCPTASVHSMHSSLEEIVTCLFICILMDNILNKIE